MEAKQMEDNNFELEYLMEFIQSHLQNGKGVQAMSNFRHAS